LKEKNIEFILASDETAEQIQRFREQHNFGFYFARVENMEELGIMALPTTFIFNPGGKLAFSEMGYRQWDDKKNIDLILNIAGSK
jgi:peroxiredoxin